MLISLQSFWPFYAPIHFHNVHTPTKHVTLFLFLYQKIYTCFFTSILSSVGSEYQDHAFFPQLFIESSKKNVKKAAPPCFYPLVVRKRVKTVRKQTPLQLMWILSVPNIKIESNLQWKVFWRHKWRRLCLDNRWIKEERNLHLCLSALQYLVQEPVCF